MTPLKALSGEQKHLAYREAQSLDGTGMLCGEVQFHHKSSQFLLDNLPSVFIIPKSDNQAWSDFLYEMILKESLKPSPASKVILDKLSEMLFTYALRQHLADNPSRVGLLSLYGHKRLNLAIQAMHKKPEKNWTLAAMAAEAMLSRTVFAETFKSVSGWTAGQYLTWWRMQLAWSQLKRGNPVAKVAENVGYKSEAAFSRAFSKAFSISAGQVRRTG